MTVHLRTGHTIFSFALTFAIGACATDDQSTKPDSATDSKSSADFETGAPSCTRWVLKNDVINARDLGGHPLGSGKWLACGKLFRGGALTNLSADGCKEFAALGIKTVIDLRQAAVQSSEPPPACVLSQAKHAATALPKLLPDTPENYLALLTEKTAIAAIFAALAQPANYPAYIHCVIGRDRASFVSALILSALGASRQTIVDEFNLSAQGGVAVQAPCIEAVLDEIEKRGGIDSYLQGVGVSKEQLQKLRDLP